ncbi:MAG: gamma-glutamyl-gamma-aminobutyrate hydrolase family protein [Halioglobus sp.]
MPLNRLYIWLLASCLGLCVLTLTVLWAGDGDETADTPRVLISLDRSLWNRLRMNRWTYVRAAREAGLQPMLVDYAFDPAEAHLLMQDIDALILSGGGDVGAEHYAGDPLISRDVNPERDDFELSLLRIAQQKGIPVLGICRGAQLINVYHGGTLGDFREDGPKYSVHHKLWGGHPVSFAPGAKLIDIYRSTELESVVSYHGQYVERPGHNVKVVAFAPDGTPEAIEVGDQGEFGMIGVQWHPEVWSRGNPQKRLFQALASAAQRYRTQHMGE